jgi:hypothetical protein
LQPEKQKVLFLVEVDLIFLVKTVVEIEVEQKVV